MKKSLLAHTCSLSLFGFAFVALPVSGQFLLSPVTVTTAIQSFNDTVSVTNLINQSGIETPFTSGVTPFDPYFANTTPAPFANSGSGGVNNWQSTTAFDLGYQGYLDFDLGASYQINKLAIWNRSLSNVTVKVLATLGGPEQLAGNFTLFDRQSYPLSYPVDAMNFGATYTGRYVRLEINGIYPFQGFTFGTASAGEVVVSALPAGGSPPPTLSISHEANGDVRVTFTGTLQTSLTASGTFTNVPGNPPSPFLIPKIAQQPRQFFRAQGN